MNKNGLSSVITSLLFLLFTFVAVLIVWNVMKYSLYSSGDAIQKNLDGLFEKLRGNKNREDFSKSNNKVANYIVEFQEKSVLEVRAEKINEFDDGDLKDI